MTGNLYVIDTSSLIQLNKYNPMDVYPGVWLKIDGLIANRQLLAPKEVMHELSLIDDQLLSWSKKRMKLFVEPTQRQIELVQELLRKYPSMLFIDRPFDADPWVIALTLELITNPQKSLDIIKRVVVTEEKLRGNKIKIPFICNDYKIETIDILGMFREEGWKF